MERAKIFIDMALEAPWCNMITPWHKYVRDNSGIVKTKIDRNPDNKIKLENSVSESMKKMYQQNIAQTLNTQVPHFYVDCSQKGEDDIMFFIFRECVKKFPWENKEQIISKIIGQRTIITEGTKYRDIYHGQKNPSLDEILDHYSELFKIHSDSKDPEYMRRLLNYESDIAFDGLAKFMDWKDSHHLYLYLDKVQHLSVDEQIRINRILYARWWIRNNKYVRLKINNGNNQRKTRYADNGHRVEAVHDYSETSIYEEDL